MGSERLNKWGRCYLALGGNAIDGPLTELQFALNRLGFTEICVRFPSRMEMEEVINFLYFPLFFFLPCSLGGFQLEN